jgi:DNA polymerase-3 subunit epsilon
MLGQSKVLRPSIRETSFAVVDVETTGFSPRLGDRIIEIAVVRVGADGVIGDEFASLIDAGRDVGPTHLHGISASEIVGAPRFADVLGDVIQGLRGAIFVAHNARFDHDFVAAEFARAQVPFPQIPVMCTLHLSYELHREMLGHRLAHCCELAGIEPEAWHSALADARATAHLLTHYLGEASARGITGLAALGCSPLIFPEEGWPSIAPSGRAWARQEARAESEVPFLAEVVRQLPALHSASAGQAAYLDLLDRALEDRILTPKECEVLLSTAQEWGLSRQDVVDAHRSYLGALISTALEDETVSESEMRDLKAITRLLALDEPTLEQALFGLMSGAPVDASFRQHVPAPDLRGMSVCFSGELCSRLDGAHITRERAHELARGAGLEAVDNVTRSLDILVVADALTQSGKANQARRYGVRIMAEAAFWRAVGVQVE